MASTDIHQKEGAHGILPLPMSTGGGIYVTLVREGHSLQAGVEDKGFGVLK